MRMRCVIMLLCTITHGRVRRHGASANPAAQAPSHGRSRYERTSETLPFFVYRLMDGSSFGETCRLLWRLDF